MPALWGPSQNMMRHLKGRSTANDYAVVGCVNEIRDIKTD